MSDDAAQNDYADNEVTKEIDESSIDLSLAWDIRPKFAKGEVIAAAEAGEGRKVIFYDKNTEQICDNVERVAVKTKRGTVMRFRDKDGEDEQHIYFGSEEGVADFFRLKQLQNELAEREEDVDQAA